MSNVGLLFDVVASNVSCLWRAAGGGSRQWARGWRSSSGSRSILLLDACACGCERLRATLLSCEIEASLRELDLGLKHLLLMLTFVAGELLLGC